MCLEILVNPPTPTNLLLIVRAHITYVRGTSTESNDYPVRWQQRRRIMLGHFTAHMNISTFLGLGVGIALGSFLLALALEKIESRFQAARAQL